MPSVMAFFLIRDLGYSGGELFTVNSGRERLCTCRFWFRPSRLIAWLSSIGCATNSFVYRFADPVERIVLGDVGIYPLLSGRVFHGDVG